MEIVLREVSPDAARAILASGRPGDVSVAEPYPTEFSVGMAQAVGSEGQFHFFVHRLDDDVVVGEIGAAFVDEDGTVEIGYAVVESQRGRGFATAAVGALVEELRAVAPSARRVIAHTPLDRPESARVLEKAGFALVRETDDVDGAGDPVRVKEWERLL